MIILSQSRFSLSQPRCLHCSAYLTLACARVRTRIGTLRGIWS